MRRPITLAASLMLIAGGAIAEPARAATADAPTAVAPEQTAVERPVSARRRARTQQPLPEPPPPAPPLPGTQAAVPSLWGEPAPIPNRSIEAPRDIFAGPPRATLEPVIIDEREQYRGFTFGREHLSSRQEILGKDLAPGARIRIPLE
ncbi:hypothetical protein [Falsiroseomonas sp. E2-1-a20]|uniref:hypothetical protein n=1 Tax=Falsiroseomonas sp. E2-1-a20 TaxID=3239300 RepID=UPI003F3BEA98